MKPGLRAGIWMAAFALAAQAIAADFGSPGGPEPANLGATFEFLRQDPYDLELLVSYGTSKGGSAGHLALAIRDRSREDERVYSANFYADRDPEHEGRHYTDELVVAIPKVEYLFGTSSSLGPKASFGLDFGEVYKRSVIGVRVYGVPAAEKAALAAFFARVNDDYRKRVDGTDYHSDEVRYGYLNLNCAKTIGAAFKHGAGYADLEVRNANRFLGRVLTAGVKSNIPTEMALKLMKEWNARGYGIDVVFYRKYAGSTWVDPHDDEPVAFKDLPDRFPSVLSRDFRKEKGEYEDFDNLFAMYVLYNLARYSVQADVKTGLLEVDRRKTPLPYPEAAKLALESAESDSEKLRGRRPFLPRGTRIGEVTDAARSYQPADPGDRKPAP